MTFSWLTLSSNDQTTFWAVVAFIKSRLASAETVEWALRLKPNQHIERMAVIHALNGSDGPKIAKFWMATWRLIEESWSYKFVDEDLLAPTIQRRLQKGERSGAIISEIVNFVQPYLEVEPIGSPIYGEVKKPRHPRTFHHLLSANLTSQQPIVLNYLSLAEVTETPFLITLANRLEAAMNHGLDIARRIGWDGRKWPFRLGRLHWAGYKRVSHDLHDRNDPDIHNRGIALVVKFLYVVVMRLSELECALARPLVQRWLLGGSPIHARLWAAVALDSSLVPVKEVETFFSGLHIDWFWDVRQFPEIAKLRALRFSSLSPKTQKTIVARLRRGPPRRYWPKEADADRIENICLYWTVRELKRIERAQGKLPRNVQLWLDKESEKFADLSEMTVEEDFPERPKVSRVIFYPDDQYDLLQGSQRLDALEKALGMARTGWDDDPAAKADAWLQQSGKASLVLNDLESVESGDNEFPHVWDSFGWRHRFNQYAEDSIPQSDPSVEVKRVLVLMQNCLKQPYQPLSEVLAVGWMLGINRLWHLLLEYQFGYESGQFRLKRLMPNMI